MLSDTTIFSFIFTDLSEMDVFYTENVKSSGNLIGAIEIFHNILKEVDSHRNL